MRMHATNWDSIRTNSVHPRASVVSSLAFSGGALIPLLLLLVDGAADALPGVALLFVDATLSLFFGRRAILGGLRMLAIGAAAGGLTFLIGSNDGRRFEVASARVDALGG